MYRGQFFTAFTIGFAFAISFIAIAAAITVLFWHAPVRFVASQMGAWGDHLSPFYLALFLSVSGICVSYWLVQIRLTWAHWQANRAIQKLAGDYPALVQTLGAERADEILRDRVSALESQMRMFS